MGLYLIPITEHLEIGRELFGLSIAIQVLFAGIGAFFFGALVTAVRRGINEDGWHSQNPVIIGDTTQLFGGPGITYTIDGSTVSYTGYLTGFNGATTRSVTFQVPATAQAALYVFAYTTAGYGIRTVQDGYLLGDLIDDNIFDESVLWDSGTAYVIGETVKNSSDVIYEATAAISSGGSQPVHTTGTTSNWKFLGTKGTLDAYNGKFAVTPEYPN